MMYLPVALLLPWGLCSSLWYLQVIDYCLNFCFLSFDIMYFLLDFLVFLRKLKYGTVTPAYEEVVLY